MDELGACALEKQIHIDHAFGASTQTYHGNPAYLAKLLFHLLNNAVKFSDVGGKIFLKIAEVKNGLELTVEDQGIGIAEIHKKRIFDNFYKVRILQGREQEGTGIGLTICKSLVYLHKGKITVESVIYKGTKITVFLPFNNL
jgi:signal transduction histidine kinase